MKLELKNVKVHPDMTEETECFSATIYVDGKKAGTVENSGKGSCHLYRWLDRQVGKQVEEWAKTQPVEFDFEKLDQVINKLLSDHDLLKWLNRQTKSKTLFRLKGEKPGSWHTVKAPFSPQVQKFIADKYTDKVECIANQDLQAAVAYC